MHRILRRFSTSRNVYHMLNNNAKKKFRRVNHSALGSNPKACQTVSPVRNQDDQQEKDSNVEDHRNTKYKTSVSHRTLLDSLSTCNTVLDQVNMVSVQLSISDEEVASRLELSCYLEEALKPYFPDCKMYLVGSSMTGFGFKGCDVDLSFQTNVKRLAEFVDKKVELPTIIEIETGNVPVSVVQQLPPKLILRFIRRVMHSFCLSVCKQPIHLVPGRCPVLQFCFGSDNSKCDLAVDNRMGIQSTKLLHFCGKIDPRVIPLTQIINYWAKHADLIGPFQKFKSYAISLLVIYFLQTRNPPILPPIVDLFNETSFFEPDGEKNWNVDATAAKFASVHNKQRLDELLRDFFFFYLFFDFNQAICPLTGEAVNKNVFSPVSEVTSPKFEMTPICIQDPFENTWNVTTGASYKTCAVLVREILTVCQLYQKNSLWIPNDDQVWGLASLLNHLYHKETAEKSSLTLDFPVLSTPCSQVIAILEALMHGLLFDCSISRSYNCKLHSKTHRLPSSIYNFRSNYETCEKCSRVGDNDITASSRTGADCMCYMNAKLTINNTWYGRSMYSRKDFPEISDDLEYERAVSQKIVSQKKMDNDKQVFITFGEFREVLMDGKSFIRVTLTPDKQKSFPAKAAIFLREFLPKVVNRLEK